LAGDVRRISHYGGESDDQAEDQARRGRMSGGARHGMKIQRGWRGVQCESLPRESETGRMASDLRVVTTGRARLNILRKKWRSGSDRLATPELRMKNSLFLKHLGLSLDSSPTKRARNDA
jgi:hypothetical protein